MRGLAKSWDCEQLPLNLSIRVYPYVFPGSQGCIA